MTAPSSPRARVMALDDPVGTIADEWSVRERKETRDCFKTPEGRYNLGKTWRTKPASRRSTEPASARTMEAEYDARCKRRCVYAESGENAYVLVNSGDCVRVLDYDAATACKAVAKIGFHSGCVTAIAWREKGESDRYDLLVGLSNGEVWAIDLGRNVADKGRWVTAATRWNVEGEGVNKSRCNAVIWRPRSDEDILEPFDCVSLHADGSMYTYNSSRDGNKASFAPAVDMNILSVVASDVQGSNPMTRWHFGRSSLNAASFSPDSCLLTVVNGAGMCRVLDVSRDRPNIVAGFKSYYAGFNAVAWSPCGRYVLAAGESDMIEIWGMYEREVLAWGVQGHRSWVTDIAVDELATADDNSILRFATVGEDCRIALWDWRVPVDDVFTEDEDVLKDRVDRLSIGSSSRSHSRGPSFVGPDANVVQAARRNEVERLVPIMTHKLHTSPVTSVLFTTEAALTATVDSVKLWLRPAQRSRYARTITDDSVSDYCV